MSLTDILLLSICGRSMLVNGCAVTAVSITAPAQNKQLRRTWSGSTKQLTPLIKVICRVAYSSSGLAERVAGGKRGPENGLQFEFE